MYLTCISPRTPWGTPLFSPGFAGDPWLPPWPSPDPPAAQGRGPDPGLGPWHLHAAAAPEAPGCCHPDPGGRMGWDEWMGDG